MSSNLSHYVAPTAMQLRDLGPGCFAQIGREEVLWVEIDGEQNGLLTGLVRAGLESSGKEAARKNHQRITFSRDEVRHLGCDRYCFC